MIQNWDWRRMWSSESDMTSSCERHRRERERDNVSFDVVSSSYFKVHLTHAK